MSIVEAMAGRQRAAQGSGGAGVDDADDHAKGVVARLSAEAVAAKRRRIADDVTSGRLSAGTLGEHLSAIISAQDADGALDAGDGGDDAVARKLYIQPLHDGLGHGDGDGDGDGDGAAAGGAGGGGGGVGRYMRRDVHHACAVIRLLEAAVPGACLMR